MLPESASVPAYSSVKTLLNGLFDYAGLFPPASLPLEDAIKEYMAHRGHPDAWMLGPFVVPVGLLDNFASLLAPFELDSPIAVDILLSAGRNEERFLPDLSSELAICARFRDTYEHIIAVEAFEFKFPSQAFHSVNEVVAQFSASGFDHQALYGEMIRDASFSSNLPIYFMTLAQTSGQIMGKIRCGGMAETDFPTTAQLAEYIYTATKLAYPFKATAGLHHPIRFYNAQQSVRMHGFINVLFASTLARVHALLPDEIERILEDENPNSFVFSPAGIQWQQLKATNTQFIEQRRLLTRSIGSCSFDEPRADLTELGWLTHEE